LTPEIRFRVFYSLVCNAGTAAKTGAFAGRARLLPGEWVLRFYRAFFAEAGALLWEWMQALSV
jgi:hypothetical protein